RCHRHDGRRSPGSEAGHISDTDRVPGGRRPGWRRLCRDSGTAGRQYYRAIAAADRCCQQAGGASARCCARSSAMAILVNVGNVNAVLELGEAQAAARTLGLAADTSGIQRAEDIVASFEALRGRADAVYVVAEPLIFSNRARIHTLAMAARLPAIYNSREYVEMGGLMSYGPNFPDLFRRAADMVDKIL